MKKLALMLVLALPLLFSACGSDEESNLELDMTSLSLNYGAEATLKASEKDCVWTSSNDFVAEVKNGVVTAKHEGTATITASKDGEEAKCQVTVNTTNDNFTLPILDWNVSMATIKSKVSGLNLELETEKILGYTTNGGFPKYIYGFVNDKLRSSSLNVTLEMDDEQDLQGFLEQRYELVEDNDESASFTYADGNNLTSANVAVIYEYDPESDSVLATWAPIQHTKSGEAFVNLDFHNEHINIVRELAK